MHEQPSAIAISGPSSRSQPSLTALIGALSGLASLLAVVGTFLAYAQGWIGDQRNASAKEALAQQQITALVADRPNLVTKEFLTQQLSDIRQAQQREVDARDSSDRQMTTIMTQGKENRLRDTAAMQDRVDRLEGKIDDVREKLGAIVGFIDAQNGGGLRGRRQSDDAQQPPEALPLPIHTLR